MRLLILYDLNKLEDVTKDEIAKFIDGLTANETKYYDIVDDNIINSVMMIKCLRNTDGTLIGIGGVAKWYKMFPHTFYMIKEEWQGQGIGNIFANNNIKFAKNRLWGIFTIVDAGNIKAVKIADRHGIKLISRIDKRYYGYRSFSVIGDIVKLFFPVMIRIYESKLGRFIKNKIHGN